MENISNTDSLCLSLQNPANKVFSGLADSFHLGNCITHVLLLISNFNLRTYSMMALSFSPSKGGTAVSKM
jgi:hypothetical protein